METTEAKQRSQRNRRRERAQRILAQRENVINSQQFPNQDARIPTNNHHMQLQSATRRNNIDESPSGEDDEEENNHTSLSLPSRFNSTGSSDRSISPHIKSRDKSQRPPRPPRSRRKLNMQNSESVFEEDIIDGFAILAFRTYEDLEVRIGFVIYWFMNMIKTFLCFLFQSAIKLSVKNNVKKIHPFLSIEGRSKANVRRKYDQENEISTKENSNHDHSSQGAEANKNNQVSNSISLQSAFSLFEKLKKILLHYISSNFETIVIKIHSVNPKHRNVY